MTYLSDESLGAVQKEVDWSAVEYDANPEALWQLVGMKHKVHLASKIEVVLKVGVNETRCIWVNHIIERPEEPNYDITHKMKQWTSFSKLNNACYAEFKTNYINRLQMKSVKPPVDLNEIFTLADTYLKPKVMIEGGGIGSTFATTADTVEIKPGEGKDKKRRGKH